MSEKNEWKPIDSAPKTGRTLLLGYWNSHGKWRTVRGQWMSAEYIAQEWEEQADAEPGWFETAVEADDIPNCWPVSPSHWQRMPAPPCPTCNDQGAVGNILTAEPCPDCTPAPSAPGDAQDGLAEAQRLAQALFQRHFAQDDDYASGRVKWEVLGDLPGVLSQIDNMVSGLVQPAAPAAGDALDAARYRWLREKAHQTAGRAPAAVLCDESDMFQRGEAGSESGFIHGKDLDDAIDAALAAQVPQQGEA